MAQIPSTWKQCGTCTFWAGSRTTNFHCERSEVKSMTDKGFCMCRTSGWYRKEKQASQSCSSFKKWEVLK